MDDDSVIWVVGHDYGYEGKSIPLCWFDSEEAARGAASLLQSGYQTAYVARVPKYPNVGEPA